MLADFAPEATIVAGGTDLLPPVNRFLLKPKVLISIRNISELNDIREAEGGLMIGPLVTHSSLANSPAVKAKAGSLAEAAARVGSPLIRNLGTIGGNICWASPAADTAPPLLTLGAAVIWQQGGRERKKDLADFFIGPNQTCLPPGALVTGIWVPPLPPEMKTIFLKLGLRNGAAISVVSVAASLVLENRMVRSVRLAFGSVAPMPFLASQAEKFLSGKPLEAETIAAAADLAAAEASPVSDVRASSWYRREMTRVYARRALTALSAGNGTT